MMFETTKVFIPNVRMALSHVLSRRRVRTEFDTMWVKTPRYLQYQKTSQDINVQSAGKL